MKKLQNLVYVSRDISKSKKDFCKIIFSCENSDQSLQIQFERWDIWNTAQLDFFHPPAHCALDVLVIYFQIFGLSVEQTSIHNSYHKES